MTPRRIALSKTVPLFGALIRPDFLIAILQRTFVWSLYGYGALKWGWLARLERHSRGRWLALLLWCSPLEWLALRVWCSSCRLARFHDVVLFPCLGSLWGHGALVVEGSLRLLGALSMDGSLVWNGPLSRRGSLTLGSLLRHGASPLLSARSPSGALWMCGFAHSAYSSTR